MHRIVLTASALLVFVVYFGAYFLAAHYVDVSDDTPHYLLTYSIGPVPLHSCALFFEPARRLDDWLFRHRHGQLFPP